MSVYKRLMQMSVLTSAIITLVSCCSWCPKGSDACPATSVDTCRVDVYPHDGLDYPVRPIRTGRASSAAEPWQTSNNDARHIAPGEELTLAELEGPGRITHIWFTIAAIDRFYPRGAVIRMYWDGEEEPSVEAPLGDFFASGHGLSAQVNSSMVASSSFGRAYNSYWKMPFRRTARVTMTNETDGLMALYWYVDWEQREVPEDVPYFHAQYRQENPPASGQDYLLADIEGKGHYVGTVMSVRMSQPGWFGEGDDRFFIDGETEPSIRGTGSEDYFNDAWAFRQFNRPNYGVSIWEDQYTGARGTMYRWHVTDPVFFDESLKFVIEHKGNTYTMGETLIDPYTEDRPDFYSSVAFWYQNEPSKPWEPMPAFKDRVPSYEILEVETLVNAPEGLPAGYRLEPWEYYGGGQAVLYFEGDEKLDIPLPIDHDGQYLIYLRVMTRADTGMCDVYLNGTKLVEDADFYKTNGTFVDVKVGNLQRLPAGEHTLTVVNKGKNFKAANKFLFLDSICIEEIVNNAAPDPVE